MSKNVNQAQVMACRICLCFINIRLRDVVACNVDQLRLLVPECRVISHVQLDIGFIHQFVLSYIAIVSITILKCSDAGSSAQRSLNSYSGYGSGIIRLQIFSIPSIFHISDS